MISIVIRELLILLVYQKKFIFVLKNVLYIFLFLYSLLFHFHIIFSIILIFIFIFATFSFAKLLCVKITEELNMPCGDPRRILQDGRD